MDGIIGFQTTEIVVACNTTDEQIAENLRINRARDIPTLKCAEPHEGIAILVGGGPSLDDTIEELKDALGDGNTTFSLNGSGEWLVKNGFDIHYQVVIDPRETNLKFIKGTYAERVFLGMQCHPSLFDEVGDWIPATGLYLLGQNNDDPAELGGGTTVGLTAMALAFALGYRVMHLFGYDSSEREGATHAYPQTEDDEEKKRMLVTVGDKVFLAPHALALQAQQFPQWARLLMDHGVELHVHGMGLLPTVAAEMSKPIPDDAAVYDLGFAPASWNFAEWLIAEEMRKRLRGCDKPLRVAFMPGPNEGFRKDNLPVDIAGRRQLFENVMRPMLPLLGAVEDPTAYNGHRSDSYVMRPISDMFRAGRPVPRFKPLPEHVEEVQRWLDGRRPITITLREATHWLARNSNIDAWHKFAQRRRREGETILFIRDTANADKEDFLGFPAYPKAALDIGIRCALYEQAEVNLFVCNGPLALQLFGTRPYLAFKPLSPGWGVDINFWRNHVGMERGDDFPWALKGQRLIWADDTLDEIEKAWSDLMLLLRGN